MRFCGQCGEKLYQDGTCPRCGFTLEIRPEKNVFEPSAEPSVSVTARTTEPSDPIRAKVPEVPATKKKKLAPLIVVILCAAVLIAGVVYGALLITKKDNDEGRPGCRHKQTNASYEPGELGEHVIKVLCTDETCEAVVSEKTESCLDEDGDLACDLCGQSEYREVLEEGNWRCGISKDGKSCTILAYTGSETEVEMPGSLNGVTVTTVASGAFSEADAVTALMVWDNVTVQSRAMQGCENLTSLVIGANCVVEAEAFADCEELIDVNVYSGVTIDPTAFSGCKKLRAGSYFDENIYETMDLPDDFMAFADSTDVGIGTLWGVDVVDDIIYGQTYDGTWVVLDLPNDRKEISVSNAAKWIVAEAVDGLRTNTVVYLSGNTDYDPSIAERIVLVRESA